MASESSAQRQYGNSNPDLHHVSLFAQTWQEGEPQLARDVGNEFDEACEDDLASEQTDFWRLKEACWISWSCSTPIVPMQVTAYTHVNNHGTSWHQLLEFLSRNSLSELVQFPYCRIFLNKEHQMSWSFPHAMSKLMTRRNIVQLEIQPIKSTICNLGIHCCTSEDMSELQPQALRRAPSNSVH